MLCFVNVRHRYTSQNTHRLSLFSQCGETIIELYNTI